MNEKCLFYDSKMCRTLSTLDDRICWISFWASRQHSVHFFSSSLLILLAHSVVISILSSSQQTFSRDAFWIWYEHSMLNTQKMFLVYFSDMLYCMSKVVQSSMINWIGNFKCSWVYLPSFELHINRVLFTTRIVLTANTLKCKCKWN